MKYKLIAFLLLFTTYNFANSVNTGHADVSLIKFSGNNSQANEFFIGIKMDMPRFSSNLCISTVGGDTLGISKKLVTPPATAARASVWMDALWVSPGSRKCTWSSINPGRIHFPPASIIWEFGVGEMDGLIRSILPSRMSKSASSRLPSVTRVPPVMNRSFITLNAWPI